MNARTLVDRNRGPTARGRRGFLMIEVTAALLVLGIVLMVTVRALGWAATEQRDTERRAWALVEAQNVLERVAVLPDAKLQPGPLADASLAERSAKALPGGRVEVTIADADGLKRIAVAIHWRDRSGGETSPVCLTTWVRPLNAEKPQEAPR